MIQWKFLLSSVTGNREVEEPEGFTEIVFEIRRDKALHGVFFENSLNELKFYGKDADFISERYNLNSVDTEIFIEILYRCDVEAEYERAIYSKLDFGRYEKECGLICSVKVGLQNAGCINIFRSRKDTKVDMDALTTFDNETLLPDYSYGINANLEIPAVGVYAEDDAASDDEPLQEEEISQSAVFVPNSPNRVNLWVLPELSNNRNGSLGAFSPSSFWQAVPNATGLTQDPESMIPIVEITESDTLNIDCVYEDAQLDMQVSLQVEQTFSGGTTPITTLLANLFYYNPVTSSYVPLVNNVPLAGSPLSGNDATAEVSFSYSGTIPIIAGTKIYLAVWSSTVDPDDITSLIFRTGSAGSFFTMKSIITCEPSRAQGCMIYESIDKVVQSITDGCMRLKSRYYGRTDSSPIAYDSDGCGSLRFLTNGLRLRNAETKKHFVSFQDMINGLVPIDNVGIGVEPDEMVPSKDAIVIEEARYFYDETNPPVIVFDNIPSVTESILLDNFFQNIKIGYEKWESEDLLGLLEPNSNREYRTTLKNVSNTLTQLSKFVAASYAIELTRRQSFAITGKADQKYDNENFILCTERGYDYGYSVYGGEYYGQPYNMVVETGNYISAELDTLNLFNIRITPVRNLLRWFKSIIGSYMNPQSTASVLEFVAGTGNFDAVTEHMIDGCIVEKEEPLAENENVRLVTFNNYSLEESESAWKPFIKNEIVRFEYPLSIKEYQQIKNNPYRTIGYICGNAEQKNGFISSVKYSPVEGIAQIELLKQYE